MNALRLIVLLIALPLLLAAGGAWELQRADLRTAKTAAFKAQLPADLDYMRGLVAQNPNTSVNLDDKHTTAQQALASLEQADDEMAFSEGVNQALQWLAPWVIGFALFTAGVGVVALLWMQWAGRRARQSQAQLLQVLALGERWVPRLLLAHLWAISPTLVLIALYESLAQWQQGTMSSFNVKLAFGVLFFTLACLYVVCLMLLQSPALLRLLQPEPRHLFGQLVRPDQAPGLWRQVNEWATRLGALPPDQIVVSLAPGCYVMAGETWLSPDHIMLQGRTLHVPLLYLAVLDAQETGALIGHELAYFVGEQSDYSQGFLPVYNGTRDNLKELIANIRASEQARASLMVPAWLFGELFLERLGEAMMPLARTRELNADAAAASLVGQAAVASALLRTSVLAPHLAELLRVYQDLNTRQWPVVEDLVRQVIDELQHRELKLSAHALNECQAHPARQLPANNERLRALRVPVEEVLASATRAPAPSQASAALNAWFADAPALCRQLSCEQVSAHVNQDTQYTQELQSHVDAVEGEQYLHEGSRLRGTILVAIALPFAALALYWLLLSQLSPGMSLDKSQTMQTLGALSLVLALGLLGLGLRLIKRAPLTALRLTPDDFVFANLAQPVPIRDISHVKIHTTHGFWLFVYLHPDAPLPNARGTGFGVPGVWLQKWRRLIILRTTQLCIDDQRLGAEELLQLLVDYINASRARDLLQ